jgi:hypothetical protein
MKNGIKKDTDKKEPIKTSMSNASKPICHEAECIGKLTDVNNEVTKDSGKEKADNLNHRTRSSMRFGGKDSCSEDECIGKT